MTDIDGRRVIDVARGRSGAGAEALAGKAPDPWQRHMACGVAMDMSAPFGKAVRDLLPDADVVSDRFRAGKHPNEAVDEVRKAGHARLLKDNDRRLAKSKYLRLAGMEHPSEEAVAWRKGLPKESLDTGKAWGLKELFGWFWKSRGKVFAKANFDFWHEQAVKSGLKAMIKVAKTLEEHLYGLLAWFDSRIGNSLTEGFNATIQALKATARGYRNFGNIRTAILF